jgi:hypothetical protein
MPIRKRSIKKKPIKKAIIDFTKGFVEKYSCKSASFKRKNQVTSKYYIDLLGFLKNYKIIDEVIHTCFVRDLPIETQILKINNLYKKKYSKKYDSLQNYIDNMIENIKKTHEKVLEEYDKGKLDSSNGKDYNHHFNSPYGMIIIGLAVIPEVTRRIKDKYKTNEITKEIIDNYFSKDK